MNADRKRPVPKRILHIVDYDKRTLQKRQQRRLDPHHQRGIYDWEPLYHTEINLLLVQGASMEDIGFYCSLRLLAARGNPEGYLASDKYTPWNFSNLAGQLNLLPPEEQLITPEGVEHLKEILDNWTKVLDSLVQKNGLEWVEVGTLRPFPRTAKPKKSVPRREEKEMERREGSPNLNFAIDYLKSTCRQSDLQNPDGSWNVPFLKTLAENEDGIGVNAQILLKSLEAR